MVVPLIDKSYVLAPVPATTLENAVVSVTAVFALAVNPAMPAALMAAAFE